MAKVECELITQDAIDVEIAGKGVILQDKSVDVEYNGTIVVKADDCFDGLKSLQINTNVPKRFECGDAVFNTSDYKGGLLPITKVDVSCLVTSQTTSLSSLFHGMKSLTEIVGMQNWDTSNIVNMNRIFRDCSLLQSLNLSNFDTSKVEDMRCMFYNCGSLQSIDMTNWDTSKVANFDEMFLGCSSLKSLNIKNWDFSNAVSMVLAFGDGFGVKELDLSGLKFTKSVDFLNCFRGTRLVRLDLSNWDLGNKSMRFDAFFSTSRELSWLDMSNWKNCRNVSPNYLFNMNYYTNTMIGDHTLEDVENGSVTLFEGADRSFDMSPHYNLAINFSSILAIANGIADLTGTTAQTWTLSTKSYNNMYNDDITIPSADVIAERQARIAAICAAKNWNFAH